LYILTFKFFDSRQEDRRFFKQLTVIQYYKTCKKNIFYNSSINAYLLQNWGTTPCHSLATAYFTYFQLPSTARGSLLHSQPQIQALVTSKNHSLNSTLSEITTRRLIICLSRCHILNNLLLL
jgi:hypothetical protein